MNLDLRLSQPGDFECWLPLWKEYVEQPDLDVERALKVFQGLINPEMRCDGIIAFLGGKGVGIAHVAYYYDIEDMKEVAYLDHLQVKADYQGQGIGRQLIDACIDRAKERGSSQISWITSPDNKAAQRLYDRFAEAKDWKRYKIRF